MAGAYHKNIIRTFKGTASRFLAIFSIVALGVGFLAGLMATPVDMRSSMEEYMDTGNFYDLRVVSTLGLTDADVAALQAVEGVEQVRPAYSADVFLQTGDEEIVVGRAHSLPREDGDINRLQLKEGRWPTAPGECIVEAGASGLNRGFSVGDTFTLTEENESLSDRFAVTSFTVVGVAHDATYFSYEREPASIGNGTVSVVFYAPPEAFSYEAYTELYLTATGALELASLEEDYEPLIAAVQKRVEDIADERCEARYQELYQDARAELDDGWQEYRDAKEEADRELADALAELEDGREKLTDGETELTDGEKEYLDGLATVTENLEKITDGESQLSEAIRELSDGQAQLEDGEAELRKGEEELATAKRQLDDGQRQYDEGVAAYQGGVRELEAGRAELADAKALLDENEKTYQDGVAALAAALAEQGWAVEAAQLDDAIRQLAALPELPQDPVALVMELAKLLGQTLPEITPDNAAELRALLEQVLEELRPATAEEAVTPIEQEMIDRIEALLAKSDEELMAEMQEILDQIRDFGEGNLTPEQEELLRRLEELVQQLPPAELPPELEQLADAIRQLVEGRRQLDDGWAQYNAGMEELQAGQAKLDAAAGPLADAGTQLADGWAQYYAGLDKLREGRAELEKNRRLLQDGWAVLLDKQLELDDAKRQIGDAQKKLADARTELADARTLIEENRQKLRDGEIEYEDAKAEVEEKLSDAETELNDAEAELAKLERPTWYVWDRDRNVSYNSFKANVSKLAAITTVFPVFFFLVAALVVSTTMNRMVEEERLQIGTMKALGYTRGEIVKKYLWYALAASALGTLVGLTVGFVAFPKVIWSAYSMMYYMPGIAAPWIAKYAVFAGGSLTVLSLAVTWSACRLSLAETPAALMLPRAPKAGKRIFLERITPLWSRLPFSYKVTCRNLFRYKKRFFMTVIGVAGCTALLVTGFGISDSLDSIMTRQYGPIYHYDLLTAVTEEDEVTAGPLHDYLFGPDFTASLAALTEKVDQELPNDDRIEVYILAPEDIGAFAQFADLHERVGGKATPLGETGVVLTEKLAATLGVKAGEPVTLQNADGVSGQFTVSGVCEHYVSNYAYMSMATYAAGFGQTPQRNTVLTIMKEDTAAERDIVSETLLGYDSVAAVNFIEDQKNTVLNMLQSINAVVVLIIVCAAALALVVLYNLTNINIAERTKEIATIKVLGFFDREVNAYVNRESVALTLLGTAVGLVMGIFLHRFIMTTVEVDSVMFGRQIMPLSFVYAAALTLVFSTAVDLFMRRKLKNISMVESMKAPE